MSDTPVSEARQRNSRASELQKFELIKYFEENPDAIRIVNGSTGDQKTKQRIWIEIAHRLNLMEGTLKSTSKWAKYWNDIIIYTRSRAKSIIAGSSKNDRAPTSVDQKILCITGQEYLLKKWMNCIKESNNSVAQQENGSNSDLSIYEEEEEVLHVSSSEPQYELCNENSEPESKVNMLVSKIEEPATTFNRSPEKRHIENEFSSNQETDNYKHPRKKPKIEPISDGCNSTNGDNDNSMITNDLNEFRDLFKELPGALITLSNSFMTLSQAINNVASTLQRRNQ